MLWCGKCRIVMDRDMVAAVNLAQRGRVRFARSRPPTVMEAQGGADESVMGNPTPRVIPRVDAPKPTPTKSRQKQIILALRIVAEKRDEYGGPRSWFDG